MSEYKQIINIIWTDERRIRAFVLTPKSDPFALICVTNSMSASLIFSAFLTVWLPNLIGSICLFNVPEICQNQQTFRCIIDRPLIINRIFLLSSLLSDENNILTWDFFIQRFETLALEAQLKAVQGGDYAFVQGPIFSDFYTNIPSPIALKTETMQFFSISKQN